MKAIVLPLIDQIKKAVFCLLFCCCTIIGQAQFPDAAGKTGSTAIHKDDAIFKAWASKCAIKRGYMDISDPNQGYAAVGDSNSAIGKPSENGIVSLGDGGEAILQFDQPIKNGSGYDFAVFENSFSDYFLELAFVEVSSDGKRWVRFPATCNLSQDTQIGPYDETSDPTKINNLAGKYRVNYGTPFDLEELKDSTAIQIDSIVYVKIIDAVGSLNPLYATYDAQGNKVNDPFATPFPPGGFDLDAVGVIHQNMVAIQRVIKVGKVAIYPNPITQGELVKIQTQGKIVQVRVLDLEGKVISVSNTPFIATSGLAKGLYVVEILLEKEVRIEKVLVE